MSANVSARNQFVNHIRIRRGLIFGAIIITALFAFEIFNYSTTEYALSDLLGDLRFAGIRWATILSIAFCGIDFAGIARLFTPEEHPGRGSANHNETWYLFGAWLLAATMNAMLTWWGVSLAILGQESLGTQVVERSTLLRVVPIFVALLVWLIRVLIIGTFSVAGDRLFTQDDLRVANVANTDRSRPRPGAIQPSFGSRPQTIRPSAQASSANRPGQRSNSAQAETSYASRPEPTYHPLSASAARGAERENGNPASQGGRSEMGRNSSSFRR
jgi:hypothetical protein